MFLSDCLPVCLRGFFWCQSLSQGGLSVSLKICLCVTLFLQICKVDVWRHVFLQALVSGGLVFCTLGLRRGVKYNFFVFAAQKALTGSKNRQQLKKAENEGRRPLVHGVWSLRRFNCRKVTRITLFKEKRGLMEMLQTVFVRSMLLSILTFSTDSLWWAEIIWDEYPYLPNIGIKAVFL